MYECGNVRRANTKTILVKNFMDTCISVACFWLIGYTLGMCGCMCMYIYKYVVVVVVVVL